MDWISDILGGPVPNEGETVERNGQKIVCRDGIPRVLSVLGDGQAQTSDAFGYKWNTRSDTYNSEETMRFQIEWTNNRYGRKDHLEYVASDKPLVLDAGCGSGYTAKVLFNKRFDKIRYVGADVSKAVDIAKATIKPQAPQSAFFQADLMQLPFKPGSFDIIISEGVLHHTPSTRSALQALAPLVKPGGIFTFYVYAKKGPIREFTDDYVRDQIRDMKPEDAWKAMEPLTKLGIALGELDAEIDIPEDITVLGIPKGRINVQRLFYWSVVKSYYRPEFTFDDMNHINFDWFAPKYAHRQTPDQVREWCTEAGLSIEHLHVEEAGITVVSRRN